MWCSSKFLSGTDGAARILTDPRTEPRAQSTLYMPPPKKKPRNTPRNKHNQKDTFSDAGTPASAKGLRSGLSVKKPPANNGSLYKDEAWDALITITGSSITLPEIEKEEDDARIEAIVGKATWETMRSGCQENKIVVGSRGNKKELGKRILNWLTTEEETS